jgi:hypothetical protein
MNTQQASKQAQQPQQVQQPQQPRVVNLPNLKKIRYAQNLAEVLQNRHVRPVVTLISMLGCDPCRLMKPRFIDFAQRNSEVFFAYIIIDEFDDKNLLLEKAGNQFPTFMIQFGEYLSIVPASLERMGEELNRLVVQVTNEEVSRPKKNGVGEAAKQAQQSNQAAAAPSSSAAQYQQMPQGVQCSPDGTCTLPQPGAQQPHSGMMGQFAMMSPQQNMVPGYEAQHDTHVDQRGGKSSKRSKRDSSNKKHRSSKHSSDRRKSSDKAKHRGGGSSKSKRNSKNTASSTDSKLYNESDSAQSSRASSRSSTSSSRSSGSSSSVDSEKLMAIIDGRDKNRSAQLQMNASQPGMFPASMQQMAQMPGAAGMMAASQQQQPLAPGVQMQLAQLAQMKQNIAAWSTRTDLTADMRALLMQQQAWVQACENKLNVEMNQGERMKMISDMRSRQNVAQQEQQRQQQMMQQQQQMMQGMMGNMGFMQMPPAAGQMPQMQQQMPGQVPTQMVPQAQGMVPQQQGGGGNYMQQHQQLMAQQQQQRQMMGGGMGHMNHQMLSTPATRISQNINNVRT